MTPTPSQAADLLAAAAYLEGDGVSMDAADADRIAGTLRGMAQTNDPAPIDMLLHCPNCGMQHIDKPEGQFYPGMTADESVTANKEYGCWDNPPHRSHLCHGCRCVWRPADVPTNGVAELKTQGKADTWPTVHGEEVRAMPAAGVSPTEGGQR